MRSRKGYGHRLRADVDRGHKSSLKPCYEDGRVVQIPMVESLRRRDPRALLMNGRRRAPVGVSAEELERNRVQLVRAQQELVQALIRRHLPRCQRGELSVLNGRSCLSRGGGSELGRGPGRGPGGRAGSSPVRHLLCPPARTSHSAVGGASLQAAPHGEREDGLSNWIPGASGAQRIELRTSNPRAQDRLLPGRSLPQESLTCS